VTDAAYTNYLVTNRLVLVPVYGLREDNRAKSIMAEHFPGRRVVGVPTVSLTEEGGAIHCVTQQEPRAAGSPRAAGDAGVAIRQRDNGRADRPACIIVRSKKKALWV